MAAANPMAASAARRDAAAVCTWRRTEASFTNGVDLVVDGGQTEL